MYQYAHPPIITCLKIIIMVFLLLFSKWIIFLFNCFIEMQLKCNTLYTLKVYNLICFDICIQLHNQHSEPIHHPYWKVVISFSIWKAGCIASRHAFYADSKHQLFSLLWHEDPFLSNPEHRFLLLVIIKGTTLRWGHLATWNRLISLLFLSTIPVRKVLTFFPFQRQRKQSLGGQSLAQVW